MIFTHYLPLATGLFAIFFFIILSLHWSKKRNSTHLLWWMMGIAFYGIANLTDGINMMVGFSPFNYKLWYITGILFGGAALAQGTVHLLVKKKIADTLSYILILTIITTSFMVIRSPLKDGDHHMFTGGILEWEYIRYITPFINTYALIFLVGGAIYSAIKHAKHSLNKNSMWGNILIATGGLLPCIGGIYAKAGITDIRYITELVGICLIYLGYHIITHFGKTNTSTFLRTHIA